MVDNPPGIDVEPGEERFVEDGANYLVTVLVGSLGCFQQDQCVAEDLMPTVNMVFGIGQGAFDLAAL